MSFGVAGPIARALFKVLQEANHHLKTGFSRSKQAYGTETVPHQDSRQGNTIGPILWTLISTKLIMMILVFIVCFAFVDNTGLPVTGEHH